MQGWGVYDLRFLTPKDDHQRKVKYRVCLKCKGKKKHKLKRAKDKPCRPRSPLMLRYIWLERNIGNPCEQNDTKKDNKQINQTDMGEKGNKKKKKKQPEGGFSHVKW